LYKDLVGNIWKDSKGNSENKSSADVRKGFSSYPSVPSPKKKKGKRRVQSSKKNITMKHTNNGGHLTQHARTEVPQN
jgi:hypothetical protein